MIRIDTIDDPRLAPYRQLKETNATRRQGLFVCEGEKLTRRLLESSFEVHSLLVAERWTPQFTDVAQQTPIFVVPDEWIETIIGFNFHRGVLACGRRQPPLSLETLCEPLASQATLVVCPDVQDPENLGTILRIASAFGVAGMILGNKTADPFSRRVLRVSMGAALRVPMVHAQDLPASLALLHTRWNFERWATVLDTTATPLSEITRPQRLAILFGSEGHGLDPEHIAFCDQRVTIPMAPGVDSLNVAISAGIFLYATTPIR
jgi:tRNA G18 (ribose-2'-O)-methylase SpoU